MTTEPLQGTVLPPPAVDEMARAYTTDCLEKLVQLLEAHKKTKDGKEIVLEPDARLQFCVARYMIELGNGRIPVRRMEGGDIELPPEAARRAAYFDKQHERLTAKSLSGEGAPSHDENADDREGGNLLEKPVLGNMGEARGTGEPDRT